jgi:hypothetical protein
VHGAGGHALRHDRQIRATSANRTSPR